MQGLKFARHFSERRKQLGFTQGDVAAYVGVSSAAVSKWEQGLSYPDLTLLPKLATLLDMTIDALLGYEPQLTKNKIKELYQEFACRLGTESFEAVQADIEANLKEYYSCYPFLNRMAQLYLNYHSKSSQPELVFQRIIELCERTIANCDDYELRQEAHMLYALVLLVNNKPQELLELLGEDIKLHYGTEQMIAKAHAMLGNRDKAKTMLQASMYQYLLGLVSSTIESMMFTVDDADYFDKCVQRLEKLISTYNICELNLNQVLVFYINAATGYAQQQRTQETLAMLKKYYETCCMMKMPYELRGDDYFHLLDDWMDNELQIGMQVPRDEQSIKKDMLNLVLLNPSFSLIQDDPAFKAIVTNLRHVLKL